MPSCPDAYRVRQRQTKPVPFCELEGNVFIVCLVAIQKSMSFSLTEGLERPDTANIFTSQIEKQ